MSEESAADHKKETQTKKIPKPEDKPFNEFITEEFIPKLESALDKQGINPIDIIFKKGVRPIVGGECWMVIGELPVGRKFWLSFSKEQISSTKTIALAESGSDPSLLESFLIDERKTTLALLISRLLQRLNGQKWLGAN